MAQLSSSFCMTSRLVLLILTFLVLSMLVEQSSAKTGSDSDSKQQEPKKRKQRPRVEEFDYDKAHTCHPPGTKNPARVYVPYFNMDYNVNCHDKVDFPDPFLVQCGLSYFGKDQTMSVNYVMGRPESMPSPKDEKQYIPGDTYAPNWIAMGNIGQSQYAPNGFSFSKFTLQGQGRGNGKDDIGGGGMGSMLIPHVHGSGAEFCYIISGSALITVTGLPQQDAEFRDPRYNLRRGENCHDETNHLWWLEDHYDSRHKGRSNHHGGLRSTTTSGNRNDDDNDHHGSSGHSHSKSNKKSGSKHYSSSGDHHDHEDSHSHDYSHSKKKKSSKSSAHYHSDQHSHRGRWWDEWTKRNCTRTTESQARYSETFVLQAGDAFVVPVGYHHYVQEVGGSEPLIGITILDSVNHVTFDTPQVLQDLPTDVLTKSLGIGKTKLNKWLYHGKRRVFTEGVAAAGGTTSHEEKDAAAALFMGPQPTGVDWARSFDPDHLQFKIHGLNRDLIPAPLRQHHRHYHHHHPSQHYTDGGTTPGYNDVQTKAVDANNHKVMGNIRISAAYTELAPGAILEPYWVCPFFVSSMLRCVYFLKLIF
jgi:mannose-6-phosphate isomerase-like protein (cupin superfamily)